MKRIKYKKQLLVLFLILGAVISLNIYQDHLPESWLTWSRVVIIAGTYAIVYLFVNFVLPQLSLYNEEALGKLQFWVSGKLSFLVGIILLLIIIIEAVKYF